MLIEKVTFKHALKTPTGYHVEIEFETSDGLDIGGAITFDSEWNYNLGFLNQFVNTDDDRYFVHSVLSSEDFKQDVLTGIIS